MCLGSSEDRRTTEVAVWVSEVERGEKGSREKVGGDRDRWRRRTIL